MKNFSLQNNQLLIIAGVIIAVLGIYMYLSPARMQPQAQTPLNEDPDLTSFFGGSGSCTFFQGEWMCPPGSNSNSNSFLNTTPTQNTRGGSPTIRLNQENYAYSMDQWSTTDPSAPYVPPSSYYQSPTTPPYYVNSVAVLPPSFPTTDPIFTTPFFIDPQIHTSNQPSPAFSRVADLMNDWLKKASDETSVFTNIFDDLFEITPLLQS